MQVCSNKSPTVLLDDDLENWMGNLPMKLKALPVIYLAIPGSHDSMTSSITIHSKLSPDAEDFLQKLKFLGPLLRFVMSRWSKTQSFNLVDQLNSGIRYFDFRVAMRKQQVYPYFVHGLYAVQVEATLKLLKEWLTWHRKEVVFLDFQHFYAFEHLDHANLIRLLYGLFEEKLMPFVNNIKNVTLDYMTKNCRYQVFIIYREDSHKCEEYYMWPGYVFPTPWPETVSKDVLIIKLNEGIAHRNNDRGYISQCVLTPTTWFVTKHLFSTLKKKCAKPLEKTKSEWIISQKVGPGGANIIISDFVEMSSNKFAKEVIDLNGKFLTGNAFASEIA